MPVSISGIWKLLRANVGKYLTLTAEKAMLLKMCVLSAKRTTAWKCPWGFSREAAAAPCQDSPKKEGWLFSVPTDILRPEPLSWEWLDNKGNTVVTSKGNAISAKHVDKGKQHHVFGYLRGLMHSGCLVLLGSAGIFSLQWQTGHPSRINWEMQRKEQFE